MVRDLYGDKMSEYQFESAMLDLINQQLRKAWNEGLRANGLDGVKVEGAKGRLSGLRLQHYPIPRVVPLVGQKIDFLSEKDFCGALALSKIPVPIHAGKDYLLNRVVGRIKAIMNTPAFFR
jgi:hypothetical protein